MENTDGYFIFSCPVGDLAERYTRLVASTHQYSGDVFTTHQFLIGIDMAILGLAALVAVAIGVLSMRRGIAS